MDLILALLRYLAFAAAALVGPGVAAQRLLGLRPDVALVLPLGTAIAAGAYWVGLHAGGWVFPFFVLALDATLLLPARRGPQVSSRSPSRLGDQLIPLALPALAVVAVLAMTQYRWNRVGPGGEFLLDPLVPYDTAFHVGLVRELAQGGSPQLPGVSGLGVGYHLGADLVRAAAFRWAAVDPYDSITRFDVTLWAFMLLIALRAAAQAADAPPAAVALAPWTLLATDLSFVFAASPQAHWWADLLRGNVLISLALSNPVVPALGLGLAALVAFRRHEGGDGRGWLVLAASLAAAAAAFKVFLGAQLALAFGAAALLCPTRRRDAALVALPCLAVTAALALGPGGETVRVAFDPLDLVRATRETLGLPPIDGVALLGWAVLWLVASLGLRTLGMPAALRALRAGRRFAAALAVLALSGWPLGLLFRVSASEVLPGQRFVNDAAYFLEQSGPVLWIFACIALVRLAGRTSRPVLVAAVAGALAIPATLQFVIKKTVTPPDALPAAMVHAMRALERESRPGDVVLQRPGARYPPAPVVLIGRRVPYERFTPWLTQFVPAADLQARHEQVHRFFRTRDRAEALAIARALQARFVCLYGGDRLRFDATEALEPVYEEPGARCYRIGDPSSAM